MTNTFRRNYATYSIRDMWQRKLKTLLHEAVLFAKSKGFSREDVIVMIDEVDIQQGQ